jgi:hypothetical protein
MPRTSSGVRPAAANSASGFLPSFAIRSRSFWSAAWMSAASGTAGPKRSASSYWSRSSISASRTRVRKLSVPSPGAGRKAETAIARRTSLSGTATSLTVAAIRSTVAASAAADASQRIGAQRFTPS